MKMKNKRRTLVVAALMILLFIGTYQVVYGGWINCQPPCLEAGLSESQCCTLVSDGDPTPTQTPGGGPTSTPGGPTPTEGPPPTPTTPELPAPTPTTQREIQNDANDNTGTEGGVEGGDPVKIITGDFTTRETDLSYRFGSIDINISRNYISSRSSSHSMGKTWSFSYDTRVIMGVNDGHLYYDKFADSNLAKDEYVINSTDPKYYQFTGNETLTVIDENGVNHLYRITTTPDYHTTATYPNGQLNFFPQGATCTAAVPKDDTMAINGNGGYLLTKKDRTQYVYSFYGQLLSIIDPNGNELSFEYDTNHQLERIVDDYGRALVFEYTDGRITKITDPKGRIFRYSYYPEGLLASRTDAEGATVSYSYSGNLITRITKPDGTSRNYHYTTLDGKSVIDWTSDEEGNREVFNYTPTGMYSEYTTASGITERHYYNDKFLVTKIVYPDGSYVEMGYDEDNNLTSYRNELGKVTEYDYDENHNLLQVMDPELQKENWTYYLDNTVASHTDKMGRTTNYHYNIYGNLTQVNYPDGATVSFLYNSRGQVTQSFDPYNKITDYTYDNFGYVASIRDPLSNYRYFEHDRIGNLTKEIDPAGNVTKYEYNGDNKLVKVTDALGQITTYTYNNRKDLVQVVDPKGNITKLAYDKRHLLTKVANPLGEVTEYLYRPDGKVSERIMNGVNHLTYRYDQRGNLAAVTQVETGVTTRYQYDAAKQLVKAIDP
jgi:YD repeat-containing protein